MKKALASLLFSLIIFFSSRPVQALPAWAELVAQSHCEYLAMGANWNDALSQALRDKKHWLEEIIAAGDLGPKAIAVAITKRCGSLNNPAFLRRHSSKQSSNTFQL